MGDGTDVFRGNDGVAEDDDRDDGWELGGGQRNLRRGKVGEAICSWIGLAGPGDFCLRSPRHPRRGRVCQQMLHDQARDDMIERQP